MTRSYKAMVHYNKNGKIANLVSQMTILDKPYKPTWWLIGPNVHTMQGMRNRKRSKLTNECRRELLVFEDGGTSALDWFEPRYVSNDTPIVVIIHTLAGGTREPCTNNLAEAIVNMGWRAVVANNRGCSGAPITSERLYDLRSIDDIEFTIKHIREIFTPKCLFLVGFSLGSYETLGYAALKDDIDGFACVSHTMNPVQANLILEKPLQRRLYLPVIMAKLIHMIKKSKFVNSPEAERAKTISEFDDVYTCKKFGLKDHIEYYSPLGVYDKIPKVRIPGLMLSADDDPFTSKKFLPIKEIEESQTMVLVHYPEGGHVSFLSGKNAQTSQIDLVVPQFFETIFKDKFA
ncbi:Clan SC, family S33, methylesterase-like serine peptidase [Histomonas meleagridis]|uniref:Clan SC, family S33, methylesterase-like serine peptidase n=1 Tax=Histomonas meleagridis TaxID=135588 RepID=UPI003559D0D7|nr:Clan SC, family S33, methylesterase-like serine peptidase [Histomonas meleagridis]KAH0796674.1 Clan SC, family S33, methylesterase-like serine peptidase [Histomonas meleagridis]